MARIPDKFQETVLFLAKELSGRKYAVRGTASLALQGLDMNVDDIDIICDKNTALICNEIFKKYLKELVEYKKSDKFKSYFGKFIVNDILIEIMGEWQIKNNKGIWNKSFGATDNQKIEITVEGQKLFVTTIQTELTMFGLMGRWTAYQKINKQIKFREASASQQKSLF